MKKELQKIQYSLRRLRLLNHVEYLRYLVSVFSNWASNAQFRKLHPDFPMPPEHLAYDAYSAPSWNFYYRSGISRANEIAAITDKYVVHPNGFRVLEWGCGPGRVIRHLPKVLDSRAAVYGTDYNAESIAWCSAHFPAVRFAKNELMPPLPFKNEFFDLVYAISVFTHLSESVCLAWIKEISRVLKKGGILYFTTHSDADALFLLSHEKKKYNEKGICVRGSVREGKKMFGAWHHPDYVRNVLLANYELLEHTTPDQPKNGQDRWIARKKSPAALAELSVAQKGRAFVP